MSSRCERWATLSDREALGEALRDEERAFLTQHAASCPVCGAESAVWDDLASLIDDEPRAAPAPPKRWPSYVAAAAALLLLVADHAGEHSKQEARVASLPVVEPLTYARVTEANQLELDGKLAREGDDLPVGATLFTRAGRACLHVEPGVRVCASEGSSFRVAQLSNERRLELRSGKLVAELEPQPAGTSFGVLTRDGASIAVGTAFSVELPENGPAITRVLHGTVLVRDRSGERRVTAHQSVVDAQVVALPAQEEQREQQVLHPVEPVRVEPARVPVRIAKQDVPAEPTAFELLSTAREERAQGDDRAALATYRVLFAKHSASPEAHAARVAYGEILLSAGDARAALAAFEQYLQQGGALAEEASFARLRALRALGQRDDEASALAKFLQTYPRSPLVDAVRKRAQELP